MVVSGSAVPRAIRRPAGSSTLTTARRARAGVNSDALTASYSCIVGWKSRWSCDRLVKAATSKTTPSTRPSASAWLLTSIATAVVPRSRMAASSACRSGASGVVRTLGSTSSPMRVSTVPSRPVERPAARSPASTRKAVVVLPLVPVIPIVTIPAAGSPCTQRAVSPSTARGSSATSTGRPWPAQRSAPAGSVRKAAAPACATASAKSAPCAREPGSAAYRSPGWTARESSVQPVTTTPASGRSVRRPGRLSSSPLSGRAAGLAGRRPLLAGRGLGAAPGVAGTVAGYCGSSARSRSTGDGAPVGGTSMLRSAKLMMSRKGGPATAPP